MATFKLLPVIVMIATLGRPPAPNLPPDLSGFYVCEGEGVDGPYRGLVEIRSYQAAYRVRWAFSVADMHQGIGVVSGSTLAVSYVSARGPGVVVYAVGDGSRLVG